MINNIDISYIQNNVETNISIIKTFFIILFTYYLNYRLTNEKYIINLKNILSIFIIAIICGVMKYKVNYFIGTLCSIIIVGISYSRNNVWNGVLTSIISLTINYIISFITLIISFILNTLIGINNDYINLCIIIITHIIILYNFLKIKKLKYGFSFLKRDVENEYIDIFTLNIGVLILFATIVMVNANIVLAMDVVYGIFVLAILMFLTIQKSLQLYYKQKLLAQDLTKTKQELKEKTEEIEKLEAENIKISKNAHTLSHKQKSLEHKIDELMSKTQINPEEAKEIKSRIEKIGKEVYKEKTTVELDKTGIVEIDDMLNCMRAECKKNKIDFELQLKGNIHYMTNNLISKDDLETLLADHIKDAIIAINHTDNVNRSVLVRLGKIDETYGLYIYDSGIEFEKDTLENLGKKAITTHKDEGGTGMGFLNTFDTLAKCNASLIIEEYNPPSKDNYSKVVIIKFDNKNEYKVKSYNQNRELTKKISTKSNIIVEKQEESEKK